MAKAGVLLARRSSSSTVLSPPPLSGASCSGCSRLWAVATVTLKPPPVEFRWAEGDEPAPRGARDWPPQLPPLPPLPSLASPLPTPLGASGEAAASTPAGGPPPPPPLPPPRAGCHGGCINFYYQNVVPKPYRKWYDKSYYIIVWVLMEILYIIFIGIIAGIIASKISGMVVGIGLQCRRDSH